MPLLESSSNKLPEITISNSIIFTDMTGTILYQTNDGSRFPIKSRELIIKYIQSGGIFVLVTGDSFSVAKQQFADYLPKILNSYFLVTEAGAEIHEVTNGLYENLYSASPLTIECRRKALEKCIEYLNPIYKIDCDELIKASEYGSIDSFLNGGRIYIESVSKISEGPFFLEVADYKVTVYAEGGNILGSITDKLLSKLENDIELKQLASSNSSILMRGAIYFELIANSKEQGISRFIEIANSHLVGLGAKDSNVDILILGDSPNDEGMYLYPFDKHFSQYKQTSVFVGVEEVFINKLSKNPKFVKENFFYLKGTHEKGTLEVLSHLFE